MPSARKFIEQHLKEIPEPLEEAYQEAVLGNRAAHAQAIAQMARGIARIPESDPVAPSSQPRGARNMPSSLPQAIMQDWRNLAQNQPFSPYGTRALQEAARQAEIYKKFQLKPWENILDQLSYEQMKLVMKDNTFARNVLAAYGTPHKNMDQAVASLRSDINKEYNDKLQGIRITPSQAQKMGTAMRKDATRVIDAKKQEQDLLSSASRLAPLPPLFYQAKQRLGANKNQESLDLAGKEIAAAGRTNIPREIGPYLDVASRDPREFIKKYGVDYSGLINNFREEARKDFLENDIPRINNQFAHKGAFYSGAREAALNKARADKERRIENEISKLLVHGQEEGMKHYHEHRAGTLRTAEVAGHAHQAEKDARIKAAESLRANAGVGQGMTHQDVSAATQLARMEQQQQQHEKNVALQEHMEEYERPRRELEREAALAMGMAPPYQTQLSPATINPAPPNPYSAAAGLIGQFTGLAGQPQQQYATGGLIRKGYAGGDSVSRAAAQLAQLKNHVTETPEEAEMRQSTQGFKNHRANPMADYLFTTGSHMLANLNADPMKAYGEGSQLGMQAYKSAQHENLTAQEKYHNLMDKINQSKMDQHGLLAKYHLSQQQHEEMVRQHNIHNAESKRVHDMAYANQSTGEEKPAKKSPTERKLESDAQKDLLRALRMKKELGNISGMIKQTATGPVAGGVKSLLPSTKIDNKLRVATDKLILDMHQGMKNIPRSEEFLKRIESTKPSIKNYPEANEEALKMMDEGANDVLEHSISTLLTAGWSPEKIEKRFKIKIPAHFLEEEEENVPQEGEMSLNERDSESMIPIIGPDGEEWMIPQENVEAALQAGGKLAQ